MSDVPNQIDGVFQAGLIALIFRAKKVGITKEQLLEYAAAAWDTAEKHEPTLRSWVAMGSDFLNSVKSEAKRQRGE